MEGRLFKTIFALLAFSLLGLAGSQALASPITIGFDKADISSTEELTSNGGYAAFQWDSRWGLVDDSTKGYGRSDVPSNQFLSSSPDDVANISDLSVAREDPFDFLGATLLGKNSRKGAWLVEIKVYDQINGVTPTWESGWLSVLRPEGINFSFEVSDVRSNVRKVTFNSRGGIFAMDDFEYQNIQAKLNEAGGLILLSIGLFGLWAARRRTQA